MRGMLCWETGNKPNAGQDMGNYKTDKAPMHDHPLDTRNQPRWAMPG